VNNQEPIKPRRVTVKEFVERLIQAVRKIRLWRVRHFEWKVTINDKTQEIEA
jgi:hypothetical protein